jgi:adenylyltransferase/sulfurtransferase
MVGMIQATEAIKVLTGMGEPLVGKLLVFDALKMSQTVVRFKRVPEVAKITELKELVYRCSVPTMESEEEVTPVGLQRQLKADGVALQVIDVRETWERALCAIESVHVPLGSILNGTVDLDEVGLKPDLPTCVYCKGGVRSLKALKVLQTQYGFSEIKSLAGGILRWSQEIDNTVERY